MKAHSLFLLALASPQAMRSALPTKLPDKDLAFPPDHESGGHLTLENRGIHLSCVVAMGGCLLSYGLVGFEYRKTIIETKYNKAWILCVGAAVLEGTCKDGVGSQVRSEPGECLLTIEMMGSLRVTTTVLTYLERMLQQTILPVSLWDVEIAICSSSKYVVAGLVSGQVSVLDLCCWHTESSGACEHRLEVGGLWALDCYQDMLVTGNEDGIVRIWDARTGTLQRTFSGYSESICKVLTTGPDTVISSSRDLTVIVWAIENVHPAERRQVLRGHSGAARDLVQHDDLLFAGGEDGAVQMWNLTNGRHMHVLEGDQDKMVALIALNQDASLLATAVMGGGMGIWDIASGARIAQCEGPTKTITQFTNKDENQLIVSAADDTIWT
ncbi:WD40 repeat-like protein [Lentithecium fluviatile CBS 122367]|uniref:WD40 repeat-like protein n=1 Tax=Lentithecium fluviatile CBS 122367 TaxID=1168545 RepID=A0A6G1IX94_9PLEO|nr:WD40 repeat-like protein [Lentithecium fluviatile CBS 122367]